VRLLLICFGAGYAWAYPLCTGPAGSDRISGSGCAVSASLAGVNEGEDEWTVQRHLLGKPAEIVALYDRFIELSLDCGPFTYAVAKSAITLKGSRRGFAGVKPGKQSLSGYLDLQRRVADPRITRSSPYTKQLFVHHFKVGQGAHLPQPRGGAAL
jgi:hypothetical protein